MADELAAWLYQAADGAGLPVKPLLSGSDWIAQAHTELGALLDRFEYGTDKDEGLIAVLLQGAVTMADHLSSAHARPHLLQPMGPAFAARLENTIKTKGHNLRPHQQRAAAIDGHLLLRSRTGSGKTEASWLWACRQTNTMQTAGQGVPRVFYTLPYLASINANADRTAWELGAPELVGVAHGRAAAYHLANAACPEDGDEKRVNAARKAVARQAATRLFTETVRITTPYQLLRAALVGPAHASLLVDAANSVFIMDELHAYDTKRLGYILAMMGLLERLGGRFAILSATLPDALADLITDTLAQTVTRTDDADSHPPARHRIRTRPHHLTDPAAVTEITEHLHRGESVLVIANNIRQAQQALRPARPQGARPARAGGGDHAALPLQTPRPRPPRTAHHRPIRRRPHPHRPTAARPGRLHAGPRGFHGRRLRRALHRRRRPRSPRPTLRPRQPHRRQATRRRDRAGSPVQPARGRPGQWFADGIYPQAPTQAAWRILTAHDGQPVDENEITDWLNTIYTTPWGTTWREEVLHHRDQFAATFLDFTYPYDDRTDLAQRFDELFDGTEAILIDDRTAYAAALDQADGRPGRLLADDYLISLPASTAPRAHYDKDLKVHVIDGQYTSEHGLKAVRDPGTNYRPTETA